MSTYNFSHRDMDNNLPRNNTQTAMQTKEELQENAVWMLLRQYHCCSGTVWSRLPDAANMQRDTIWLLFRWCITSYWSQEQGLSRLSL